MFPFQRLREVNLTRDLNPWQRISSCLPAKRRTTRRNQLRVSSNWVDRNIVLWARGRLPKKASCSSEQAIEPCDFFLSWIKEQVVREECFYRVTNWNASKFVFRDWVEPIDPITGRGYSSVGTASDRHAAEAGSIPRCGKGFSPRINFQCRLSHGVRTSPCAIVCIYICEHAKDPVVHAGVLWIMETPKHPACTIGRVARLYRSWLSPGKASRISHGRNPIGTIQV